MHDPLINKSLVLAGLILLGAPVAACNTIEGAGEDVENVGEAGAEVGEELGEEAGEID